MSEHDYPARGSVVKHQHAIGLYCGPYIGMPGWGSIIPEIHPGEFDPSRERIVKIAALVVIDPAPGREVDQEKIPAGDPQENLMFWPDGLECGE